MLRRITLALVVLAFLAAVADPAVARVRLRYYGGTTSDGGSILLVTVADGGQVRFQALGVSVEATCEDGSTLQLDRGIDLSPLGVPVEGGALDVSEVTFADAFSLSGRLGSKAGSGAVRLKTATLDAAEEPQVCSADLTWHAERLPSGTSSMPLEPPPMRFVDRSTGTTTLVGDPDATTARPVERLRNYSGRTSAGYRMFVVTQKRPEGLVMHELGIVWHLACEDGQALDLGFFILFAGEPLEAGRLDHDVSAPELAFHVNGRLGSHTGDGTTTSIVPALTEDLDAQACRSGDVTWRAWRTDPGY